jgi:glycosyltransferase involved in cell wall biosynthesis
MTNDIASSRRKKISIVSPCYNEQDNVRACYETVRTLFERDLPGYEREHVFADNCSTDGTVAILREIAASDPAVKIVVNARNFGVFRSTFNALRYATGDGTLLMLPVDLQDPPDLLPQFVRLWEQGYDVVAGQRSNREEGLIMRTMRGTFYRIVNRLAGFEIPEGVGEFQLVDRKVLDNVLKYDDHYPYIRGMVAACGFKRIVIPYVWKSRKHGVSKIRIWELFDQAFNGMFSFTNVPMRLCTLFGFALAACCLLYAVVTLGAFVIAPAMMPRGLMSVVIGMFFLFSIQLIFIGLLGEYVTSIHAQVRRGPLVTERERLNID